MPDILGEWIYQGRNEPALYVCGSRVTVLARIECKDELSAAKFRAEEPAGATTWRNLRETRALFVRKTPGVDLWVTQGAGPDNEYCEFPLEGFTPSEIRRVLCTWQWKVRDVEQVGQIVQPPMYPLTATGPHKFYTVLRGPWHPWYWGGHPEPERTEPWTRALDLLIDRANLDGETMIDYACDKITDYLHRRHGLRYDHGGEVPGQPDAQGQPGFVRNIEVRRLPDIVYTDPVTRQVIVIPGAEERDPISNAPVRQARFDFHLNAYLNPNPQVVNCYDQAAGVMVLANLVGGWTWYRYMCRFGYINEIEHVGGKRSNNPFFKGAIKMTPPPPYAEWYFPFDRREIVGADDLQVDSDVDGDLDRSAFGNHAFVMAAPGYDAVWDACVGPIRRKNLADYLWDAIDRSTVPEAAVAGSAAQLDSARGIPFVYLR